MVYAGSTKQDLAYQLVEYLTGVEGQKVMAGVTGNFAANLEAAKELGYDSDPYLAPFAQQLATAVARPTLSDWLKVNAEVIGAALDEVLVSGADPATVLPDAAKRADTVLFGM